MRALATLVALAYFLIHSPAGNATEYRYCVSCDNYRGNVLVSAPIVDFGKEWYRVKTAELLTTAKGSQSCSARDYSPEVCGDLPSESLEYRSINGDQIDAILSGNPITMGQSLLDSIISAPVEIFKSIRNLFGW